MSVRTRMRLLLPSLEVWREYPSLRGILVLSMFDAAVAATFAGSITVLLIRTTKLSLEQVGVGLSIGGLIVVLATIPLGRLVDRIGPKRYLVCASVVSAIAYAAFPLVDSVLFLSLVVGVAGGAVAAGWSALQTLIGSVADDNRPLVLGTLRAARNVGYAVAGALIGLAIWLPPRMSIVLVAAFAALSYFTSAVIYGRQVIPREVQQPPQEEQVRRSWRDTRYVGLMLASTVFAFSTIVLDIGFPLWITRLKTVPEYLAGMVLLINTVLVIFAQAHAAKMASSIGRSRVAILGAAGLFSASFVLMFGLAGNIYADVIGLVIAAILFTAGEVLESSAWWTISYELAPEATRNEHLALFSLNYQIVGAVGPIAVTAALAVGRVGWLFFAAAIILACVFALLLSRNQQGRLQ